MPDAKSLRAAFRAAGSDIPELKPLLARPPEPFLGFPVAATDAIATWRRLRALTEKTGYYPLVLADQDLLDESAEEYPPAAELLSLAARIDPLKWLKQKAAESEGLEAAEWPDDPPVSNSFLVPFDAVSGKPRKDVKIILLPTRNPWEAAAHIAFAAVNFDIEPQHHIAVHQRWFKTWGAEPVTASGDVLEFHVARPPASRKDAMTIAGEQYAYCPDIVDQGVETLENLAAAVLDAPVWFFWWD